MIKIKWPFPSQYLRLLFAKSHPGGNESQEEEAPSNIWLKLAALLSPLDCKSRKQCLVSWLVTLLTLVSLFFFFEERREQPGSAQDAENMAMDALMRSNINTDPRSKEALLSTVLYNIDEKTYREWGSPAITPRDKLLALVKSAEARGASVIILDFDFSRSSDGYIAGTSHLTKSDNELGKYLAHLNESKDSDSPIVIISRTFRKPLRADGEIDNQAPFELLPSYLDNYIQNQRKVFFGGALFNVDRDNVIRRWRLAEVYCQEGKVQIIPSVQLMSVLSLAKYRDAGSNEASSSLIGLRETLEQIAGGRSCNRGPSLLSLKNYLKEYGKEAKSTVNIFWEGRAINLAATGNAERIVYRISPENEQGKKSQLEIRRVSDVLSSTQSRLDADGKIVMIAASFRDSADLHMTPISSLPLPGSIVLINSIDTLQNYGQFSSPPIWLSLLLLFVGYLLLQFIESRIPFFFGKMIGSSLTILILFLISVSIFSYGIGVSYGLPLVAIETLSYFAVMLGKLAKLLGDRE